MSIQDYFQKPDAERILLLEIQRSDAILTRYYISDSPYTTGRYEVPENMPYSPIIGGRGLPGLRRTLSDVFRGGASTSFGTVELVSEEVLSNSSLSDVGVETTLYAPRGAEVYAYLAAPNPLYPRDDAILLFRGKVGRTGGDAEGSVSIEIIDGSERVADQVIEVQEVPLCFGYVRNMTPVLVDPGTRKYAVHDSAIEGITAVYDSGVTLSPTQYTVNTTTGTFTLATAASGVVTADVKGAKVSGVWLSSTQQIIEHLLVRSGISGFTNVFSIPSGVIGFMLNQSENLSSIFDKLMRGVGGYWIVEKYGNLSFKTFPVSSGMGFVFTEDEIIQGTLNYQDDFQLYKKIPYSYKNNWTVIQPRAGADPALSTYFTKQYLEGEVNYGSPNPEFKYSTSPIVNTYFDNAADAAAVSNFLLSIYQVPRRILKASVPYVTNLDIGSTCTFAFNNKMFTGVVTEVVDVFDGNYPIQELEVLI